MISVGRVADPRLAQAFVDYMAVKGGQCQIQVEDEIYAVHASAEHYQQAVEEFQLFAKEPLHQRYRSASWNRNDRSSVQFDYGASGLPLLHQVWVQAGPVTLVTLILQTKYLFGFYKGR